MQALDCIEFARHGADMFLVSRVEAGAPLARLLIQILPSAELATHQKVPFDKPERPFDPCGAIRVAALMRHKVESEALGERFHFRNRNHFPPRAAQHHHVLVGFAVVYLILWVLHLLYAAKHYALLVIALLLLQVVGVRAARLVRIAVLSPPKSEV